MGDEGRHGEATGLSRLVVPSSPRSVAVARRFAVQTCDRVGWGRSADIVALLVSEVATNAVLHAPGDEIGVRIVVDGGRLRVEVDDASPASPVPRGATAGDESGRGLALVAAMAVSWGVQPRHGGKTVWFEIDG